MVKNKTPWIVGGCLIVLFAVIALVAGSSKKSKSSKSATPPPNARAVEIPANRQRTVVVAPCGAPVKATLDNAAAGKATPGATTLALHAGKGVHTLLVPICLPKTGATNASGNLPSGALVLNGSDRPSEGQQGEITSGSFSARDKVILPDGSNARTVVISPCDKATKGKGKDVVIGDAKGHPGVALAPSC